MGQFEYDHYHDGTGSPAWGPASGDHDDRPSPSDFAEEDWDRERRSTYPRGEGPPHQGEDYPDPELESYDEHDPQRHLSDPGFGEEEVDDWPDPDVGHAPLGGHPLPFGTPVYNPGGGFDPSGGRINDDEDHGEEHRIGAVRRQSDQWPDRVAGAVEEQWKADAQTRQRDQENQGTALGPDEHFRNKDPERGTTVPDMIGGDPSGSVNVRPHAEAGPQDAFMMPGSESGLGYDALVRPSEHGGFEVLKPLE